LKRAGGKENRTDVISYTLYGNYQKYAPTLRESIELITRELPDWQVRVYLSEEIPKTLEKDFLNHEVEVSWKSAGLGSISSWKRKFDVCIT
jgi:hypothetical protein